MDKFIKNHIVFFLILCLFFLPGCQAQPNSERFHDQQNEIQAYQVTLGESGLRTYIDIYQKKLFYMDIDGNKSDFYVYNFDNGKVKKISTVPNFALKGKSNAFADNTLFFYISIYNGGDLENILYAMDFSKENMYQVTKNSYSQKLIPLITMDNKLLSLQGDLSDKGSFQTFIEEIDNSGKTAQVTLHSGNGVSPNREAQDTSRQIVYFDSDNKYVYAIEKDFSSTGIHYYYTKYNQDYSVVNNVDITDVFKNYEITDQIGSFFAFNDCICLTDYSNNTIIGEVKEKEVHVFLCESDVEYIDHSSPDFPYEFFYKRNTNDIYKLNTQSGEIQIQNYDLKNDSSIIRVVLSNEKDLLIIKKPVNGNSNNDTIYLIPKIYERGCKKTPLKEKSLRS